MTDPWSQPASAPQGYPPQAPPPGYPQQYAPPPTPQAQPGYPAAQPGWGAPPPQAQPQPQAPAAPPAPSAEDLWNDNGPRASAPSFKFKDPGDGVIGTIESITVIPKTDPKTKQQKLDKNGKPQWQHMIVLQTALRNWASVSRIPQDSQGNPLPPTADDGKRAVYAYFTLRDAIVAATGGPLPQVGMELGVQFTHLRDPNDPAYSPKEYRAVYRQPQAGGPAPAPQGHPAQPPAPPAPAPQGPPAQPPAPAFYPDEPPF